MAHIIIYVYFLNSQAVVYSKFPEWITSGLTLEKQKLFINTQ